MGRKIRVAIAGVGNCASSLVQGKYYYQNNPHEVFGLDYQDFGGYKLEDIEFVCGFDINSNKVGEDIGRAIFAKPNCAVGFATNPKTGNSPGCLDTDQGSVSSPIILTGGYVFAAPVLDGMAKHMHDVVPIAPSTMHASMDSVVKVLKDTNAEVLINYLPVGSAEASRFYAQACLYARVNFINAIPEFICSDEQWGQRFEDAELLCAGDDIKSQVGATILHRVLANLVDTRGLKIDHMYQLNIGGNTDFQNMIDETRLESKRISKTNAVLSILSSRNKNVPVKIGPSDFVSHLGDNKVCYINIKGRQFGDVPFEIECKLSVEDSPNSAGVIVDVVRAMALAKDSNFVGPLRGVSSYYFKSPPYQMTDTAAHAAVNDFINQCLYSYEV